MATDSSSLSANDLVTSVKAELKGLSEDERSGDWTFLKVKHDVELHTKMREGWDVKGVKAVHTFEPAPHLFRALCHFFGETEALFAADPMVDTITRLQSPDPNALVLREVDKFPFPLSNREFVYALIRLPSTNPQVRESLQTSVDHPACPEPTKKLVRGRVSAKTVVERLGDDDSSGVKVTYIGYFDLNGSVPKFVINSFLDEAAAFFVNAKKFMSKHDWAALPPEPPIPDVGTALVTDMASAKDGSSAGAGSKSG